MNIADKTLQLKKDFDDVYKAGQSSMVDESKIIEKSVSGEYISVDDVSEIPHEVKVMLTSGGKNLWKHGDQIFTGINTGRDVNLLAGVTYTFSADVTTTDTDYGYCLVYDVTNNKAIGYPLLNGAKSITFTPTADIKSIRLYASRLQATSTGDEATFKDIMIEQISGENLFDINDSTIEKKRRLSANAGTSWSNSADGSDNFNVSHYIPVEGGKNYTAYNTNTGSSWYCWYDKDKVYISGGGTTPGKTLTAPSNACYFRFDYPSTDTNVTFCELFDPSPYEPYKETLTDYSGVSLTRVGNNLIPYPYDGSTNSYGITFKENSDGSITLNGTNNGNGNSVFYITKGKDVFVPKGIYSGSVGVEGVNIIGHDADNVVYQALNYTHTVSKDKKYVNIYIQVPKGATITFDNVTIYPMWNFGSTALPYEPYNGQTLTANSDGTVEGVKSTSPYMYMTTDNANCTINAEYHKSYGMQTEYDRFWDSYQDYGNRTDYHGGFGGKGWNKETFKPKYDIIVDGGDRMFMWFNWNDRIFDLKEHLEDLGITLDFSQAVSSCYMPFYRANISRLGTIDISKSLSTSLTTFFYYSPIIEIEKFIVNSTQDMSSAFEGMSALEIISFGGTIGGNTNFKWSTKLSKASILNIFEHLSSTVTGKTLTLSTTAVTNAFGSTTATEWTNLVATKTNWTISLV